MDTAVYLKGKRCHAEKFDGNEDELEKVMISNYKQLFGKDSLFVQKTKVKTSALGNSVPDGFLFDLKDPDNPEFYLIEVELDNHSWDSHIFPQITKFFAFFTRQQNRKDLIEKIYSSIKADKELQEKFSRLIEEKDIHKVLTDAVENSKNIILVMDKLKKNKEKIDEAKEAYQEWDKHVKVEILQKFNHEDETILTLTPPFEEVDISEVSTGEVEERYDENYHLSDIEEEGVEEAYHTIKDKMLEDESLDYNPQKYYISIRKNKNFAFIKIRRKKMHIVIMLSYEVGKQNIRNHTLSTLSQRVQDYYNGSCFQVTIEKNEELEEVIDLLKRVAEDFGS